MTAGGSRLVWLLERLQRLAIERTSTAKVAWVYLAATLLFFR